MYKVAQKMKLITRMTIILHYLKTKLAISISPNPACYWENEKSDFDYLNQ